MCLSRWLIRSPLGHQALWVRPHSLLCMPSRWFLKTFGDRRKILNVLLSSSLTKGRSEICCLELFLFNFAGYATVECQTQALLRNVHFWAMLSFLDDFLRVAPELRSQTISADRKRPMNGANVLSTGPLSPFVEDRQHCCWKGKKKGE